MATTDPRRRVVENLLAVQRLANGVGRDVEIAFLRLFGEIEDLVRRVHRGGGTQAVNAARAARIVGAAAAAIQRTASEAERLIRADAAAIGSQQADWAVAQLRATLGELGVDIRPARGLNVNHFKRLLDNNPFEGDLLKDWTRGLSANTVRRVRQEVNLGVANDETVDDVVRRLRGTRKGTMYFDRKTGRFTTSTARNARAVPRYTGGVLGVSTRDAQSIARTAITFVQNEAHRRAYEQNSKVLSGVQFTAVLDASTTPLCARWDGTVWEVGSPDIQQPPLHWRCRSVLTPVPDWEALGVDKVEASRRAARTGVDQKGTTVSSATTYETWLRSQPKTIQDQVLGRGKAELFRRREISLRDIVTKDNTVLTLEQVKANL